MDTFTKSRIAELEKENESLESRMLKAFDSGSTRVYNNLKNEQTANTNEIKKLKSRLGNDSPKQ